MTYRIVQRFEKGQKFLDLIRYSQRSLDDDGASVEDEVWECVIYDNDQDLNMDLHRTIEFPSEFLARLFIEQNQWKEQVL